MKMIKWLMDLPVLEKWIIACIVGLLVAVGWGSYLAAQEKAEFMEECEQDRPKYECTAMWREGTPKTVIVPVR
jgi:hypothetical protein